MTLPNLNDEKIIALDIETSDPWIKADKGSGARGGGYILGVGIATKEKQFYFPLAHSPYYQKDLYDKDERIENVEAEKFFAWLRDLRHVPTVGANLMYDLDYLQYQGYIPKECHDIQYAEPLLDEEAKSYSLDTLAGHYLGEKKQSKEINDWCKNHGLKGPAQEHLAKMPASLVGKYCMEDCRQTLAIFEEQMPRIEEEKLEQVYDLERSLFPMMLKMKRTGVRIHTGRLENLKDKYFEEKEKHKRILLEKKIELNENENITSNAIQKFFKANNISYKMSKKDNPIFDKKELLEKGGEIGAAIVEYRHVMKMLSTYIIGIEQYIIHGRVHPEFNQLRSDSYGTVIGRFSGTRPNMQNIPRPDDEYDSEMSVVIRSLFIPEENCLWAKLDYSQMEMAIFAHFARGEGAEDLREMYRRRADADIYKIIAALAIGKKIEDITKEERKLFKTISLGVMYGMTADKLGRSMGIITLPKPLSDPARKFWDRVFNNKSRMSWEQKLEDGYAAADIDEYPYLDQYMRAWKKSNAIHKAFPCLKKTAQDAQATATKQGYTRTISGRKRRFHDPSHTYKAFQAIDSGTGADIMKTSMVVAYDAGLFDVLFPHITVHDELGVSFPDTNDGRKALEELKNIMETSTTLKVPLRVDVKTGESWGGCK